MADDSKTPLVVSNDGHQSYRAALEVDFQTNKPSPYSYDQGENHVSSDRASLSFHNISYTVNVGLPCRRQEKVILRNCRFVLLRTPAIAYLSSAIICSSFVLLFHGVNNYCTFCLRTCSGIMQRGLNAIMGPTGSGKTTLVDSFRS